MENHHHQVHSTATESEVSVTARYENGTIIVEIQDKHHEAPELEMNHEKNLHLIVVSDNLNEYKHLHPIQTEKGKFEQKVILESGMYKLFVDIQPKGLAYLVKPIHIHVEPHRASEKIALQADVDFRKNVDGREVELSIDSLKAHQPTVFTFDTKENSPEPYLGALGHVVILDEKGEQFIHVHPSSHEDTVFETVFHKKGLYKIWGEFKFEGKVFVYPYVIEITD